jgi:hypothetical protein
MCEEIAVNISNSEHRDVADGEHATARVMLVELESLVGNLYRAKEVIKSAPDTHADCHLKQQ